MKILCTKCSRPIAFATGKMIQIKRGDNLFSIYGTDFNILASCAGHCGYQNVIMVENGKLLTEDLKIEEIKGGDDGKRQIKKEEGRTPAGGSDSQDRGKEGRDKSGSDGKTERGKESGDDTGGKSSDDGGKTKKPKKTS